MLYLYQRCVSLADKLRLDYITERGYIIQDDYSLILDNSIVIWYPLMMLNRRNIFDRLRERDFDLEGRGECVVSISSSTSDASVLNLLGVSISFGSLLLISFFSVPLLLLCTF